MLEENRKTVEGKRKVISFNGKDEHCAPLDLTEAYKEIIWAIQDMESDFKNDAIVAVVDRLIKEDAEFRNILIKYNGLFDRNIRSTSKAQLEIKRLRSILVGKIMDFTAKLMQAKEKYLEDPSKPAEVIPFPGPKDHILHFREDLDFVLRNKIGKNFLENICPAPESGMNKQEAEDGFIGWIHDVLLRTDNRDIIEDIRLLANDNIDDVEKVILRVNEFASGLLARIKKLEA